jgi:hypothetical protein
MPRKLLKRLFPSPETVRHHKSLKKLDKFIHDSDLWHLNQRCVPAAFFIGIFIGFIPTPGQMLLAALFAILLRANLLISVALTWLTNPITTPPIVYFSYKVGNWMLHNEVKPIEFQFTFEWFLINLSTIGLPVILGSVTSGLVLGSLSYFITRSFWRWHVANEWKKRKLQRSAQ